jgi:hypothetical protein
MRKSFLQQQRQRAVAAGQAALGTGEPRAEFVPAPFGRRAFSLRQVAHDQPRLNVGLRQIGIGIKQLAIRRVFRRRKALPVSARLGDRPAFPRQLSQQKRGIVAVAAEERIAHDFRQRPFIARRAGRLEPAACLRVELLAQHLQPGGRHG